MRAPQTPFVVFPPPFVFSWFPPPAGNNEKKCDSWCFFGWR
jgi:hypothetical protein